MKGKVVLTPEAKQPFEIKAEKIEVEGTSSPEYPLQKKRHSFEYLREIGHLRPRTNTFSAVFRVRSALAMAIHTFFQEQGFVYVHTPEITGADAEGAGETFTVTTREDGKYEEDFFGKHASLTVSGQLQAEAFALAFRDVYTFGPTFRAENLNYMNNYDFVGEFNQGVAIVIKDNLYGAVTIGGYEIIPPIYDYISPFNDGYAEAIQKGECKTLDLSGKEFKNTVPEQKKDIKNKSLFATTEKYDSIERLNNGICIVSRDKKYGCINQIGRASCRERV
mgnify:CR=1 FL=1